MSDAIRNVTIKVGIEQKPFKFEVPDVSPILKSIQTVTEVTVRESKYQEGAVSSVNFHKIKMAEVAAIRQRQLLEKETTEYGEMISRQLRERIAADEAAERSASEAAAKENARIHKQHEAIGDLAESVLKFGVFTAIANKDGAEEGNKFFETTVKLYANFKLIRETAEKIAPALGVSYGGRIALLPGQSKAEEFTTLVHECAHELLHKTERRTMTTATVRETEAEAVAFIVGQAIGLEMGTASSDYIQMYAGNAALLTESLEVIQRTSAVILGALSVEATEEINSQPVEAAA